MSKYICPFCNKEVFFLNNSSTLYTCFNHKAKVDILEEFVFIYNNDYDIAFAFNDEKQFMRLYRKGYRFIMDLPLDKSLTPDNFEEKLSFYLMFK
jgi:hypothetical protein